jgi:hypothetical protein
MSAPGIRVRLLPGAIGEWAFPISAGYAIPLSGGQPYRQFEGRVPAIRYARRCTRLAQPFDSRAR